MRWTEENARILDEVIREKGITNEEAGRIIGIHSVQVGRLRRHVARSVSDDTADGLVRLLGARINVMQEASGKYKDRYDRLADWLRIQKPETIKAFLAMAKGFGYSGE